VLTDLRALTFSSMALRQAFELTRQVAPERIPPGPIASIVLRGSGPDVTAVVLVQQPGATRLREVEVPAIRLAAMLILFCRKLDIPLPRQARKRLAIVHEGGEARLSLLMEQSIDVGMRGFARAG